MGKHINIETPESVILPFPKNENGHYIIFKTRNSGGGRTGGKKFKDGYIYFLKIRGLNLYKIGVTNKPKRRLHDIDSYLPFDFDILSLHYFENIYDLEHEIMQRIKSFNVKREWFDIPNEIAKNIMIDLHNKSVIWQHQ